MSFLLAAGLLLALVVGLLLCSLLRKPRRASREDMQGRLEAELADDVAAGVLDPDDFDAAVSDIEVDQHGPEERSGRGGRWVWGLIALVAVAGVLVYWQTGNWRAAIHGDRAAVMHRANGMLARLQAHLGTHPDDEQGWITLGEAKSALGDYGASAKAYGKAVKLDHEQNPGLLARWGEARILANPGHLDDQDQAIFSAVLKADPDNVRGLWYGGLLALDTGRRKLAIARWQRLLKQDIPKPMAAFVTSRLHKLGAQPAGSAARPAAVADAPRLSLTVKLAPDLAGKIQSGATLFVYVRSAAGGPPLAVKRVAPKAFPLHLVMDDRDAMLAHHDLASALGKSVTVGAFVSADGNAYPGPGDPLASKTLRLGSGRQALALTLARKSAERQ